MSAGAVRRWALYESKGVMVISANGNWVEHADHKSAIDALHAQADEWERKGRELCIAHGNLLIEHHDLKKQAVALAQTVMMLCEKHGHTDYPSYQQAQALLEGR
jgi:hypothetical protein